MAQNITLLGATYSDVPSVLLPKQGGGQARFDDTTIASNAAAAADIANGKLAYVNGSLVTGTSSGGTVTLKEGAIRPDAEKVKTWTFDQMLVEDLEVTPTAYTTAATTVIASENLTATYSVDYTNYDYLMCEKVLCTPQYNVSTYGKGRFVYNSTLAVYELLEIPKNTFVDGSRTYAQRQAAIAARGSQYRGIYYSSATAITGITSAYGDYGVVVAPAVSSGTVTMKTPTWSVKGHGTYFTSTYMNAVSDVRLQYVFEMWRVPKGDLNYDGYGLKSLAMHVIACAQGDGTLT